MENSIGKIPNKERKEKQREQFSILILCIKRLSNRIRISIIQRTHTHWQTSLEHEWKGVGSDAVRFRNNLISKRTK